MSTTTNSTPSNPAGNEIIIYAPNNLPISQVTRGTTDQLIQSNRAYYIDIDRSAQLESNASPLKVLEKERKTAAIEELDRLGMKTRKRVAAINAIQFLDNTILIENTPWDYNNMEWWNGTFKEQTNKWYYDFAERIAEANKQNIILPTKEDFENTFEALHLEENDIWKHILAIILWESMSGYCNSGGHLYSNGLYGYLGSVSERDGDDAWGFKFDEAKGLLYWDNENIRLVCRPLVKRS